MNTTALEDRLLMEGHRQFGHLGFPHPSGVLVTERIHTGAGRHTVLRHFGRVDAPNGILEMGQFDMPCLKSGAIYRFVIESGEVRELEIIVNGTIEWDGAENPEVKLYDHHGNEY